MITMRPLGQTEIQERDGENNFVPLETERKVVFSGLGV